MRRWFVLAAAVLLFLDGSPTIATDYILKRIDCPSELSLNSIKLDFVDHIGSDPTFTLGSGGSGSGGVPTARSTGITRDGQKISCSYAGKGIASGRIAVYSYTVHRKIEDCKTIPGQNNALDCRLKP